MKIQLLKLELTNFKGTRNASVNFGHRTTIKGANATGKTNLFDAFTWVMFGKNSQGSEKFAIKTNDRDGNTIERMPHEVTATLDVDGMIVTLKKSLVEKWTKRRGSAEEEYTGNTVELSIDGVSKKEGEYKEYINTICPESIFKIITNPLFFCSLPEDQQREMLINISGIETNDNILATKEPRFKDLVDALTNMSLRDYKTMIASKKKPIKERLAVIPAMIQERKRDITESRDWDAIEKEVACKKSELGAIRFDVSIIRKRAAEKEMERDKRYREVCMQYTERANQIRHAMDEAYMESMKKYNEEVQRVSDINNKKYSYKGEICALEEAKEEMNRKITELRKEWEDIHAETIDIEDDITVCPTCHQQLPEQDIEDKRNRIIAEFNVRKAERLKENERKGIELRERIKENEERYNAVEAKYTDIHLMGEKPEVEKPEKPDFLLAINTDKELKELEKKKKEISSIEIDTTDSDKKLPENIKKEGELEQEISQLNKVLSERENNKKVLERIEELVQEERSQSEALAELEKSEFMIQEFSHYKMDILTKKINGMFTRVKFRLYEKQVNGGERETCQAMVDGVPFSDANTAGKINAGLDIIQTISKSKEAYAPIFIDNRESVSDIIDMDSQVINLVVDDKFKKLDIQIEK